VDSSIILALAALVTAVGGVWFNAKELRRLKETIKEQSKTIDEQAKTIKKQDGRITDLEAENQTLCDKLETADTIIRELRRLLEKTTPRAGRM
jgi:predicted RNase H-like nuclease (RuvC/YqgF family)